MGVHRDPHKELIPCWNVQTVNVRADGRIRHERLMRHLQVEDVRSNRGAVSRTTDVKDLSTVNSVVPNRAHLRSAPNVKDDEVDPPSVPRVVGLERGACELHSITEVQVQGLFLRLLIYDGHGLTQLLISLLLRWMRPGRHRLHVLRAHSITDRVERATSEGKSQVV